MSIWVHVTGNTYGTWMPGDPRGFGTRHHREHITSDARAYESRRAEAEEFMREVGREPVRLSADARKIAIEIMVEALQFRQCEVRIACLDDHHFHILFRLPSKKKEPTDSHRWVSRPTESDLGNYLPEVRDLIGRAKRRAARALSEKGLVGTGGVWATRVHMRRILEEAHMREAIAYIAEHGAGNRGAAVWNDLS